MRLPDAAAGVDSPSATGQSAEQPSYVAADGIGDQPGAEEVVERGQPSADGDSAYHMTPNIESSAAADMQGMAQPA